MAQIDVEVVMRSCRPPKEIENYFPPHEVLYHGTGKNLQRNIFKHQTFNDREVEKIKRLKELITKQKFSIPLEWDDSDLLKFIYGANFKTRNAFKALKSCLESKTEILGKNYLLLYSKIYEILKLGPLYMHGRDCYFRPLLVMNFTKFDLKKFPLENYLQAACFMLEFAANNMLYPGKAENWMCISDLGYRGLTDLPLNTLRKITKYLQDIFKCRVAYSSMINAPKSINFIYSCLKPFLDPVTIEKISLEKGSVPFKLLKFFNPYQVEQRYGGKAPDLDVFWPPVFPDYSVAVDYVPVEEPPDPVVPELNRRKSKKLESRILRTLTPTKEPDSNFLNVDQENIVLHYQELELNKSVRVMTPLETYNEEEEIVEEQKEPKKKRKHKKKNRKSKKSRKERNIEDLAEFMASEVTERKHNKVLQKPKEGQEFEGFSRENQEAGESIEVVHEIIPETQTETMFCQWNLSGCQIV